MIYFICAEAHAVINLFLCCYINMYKFDMKQETCSNLFIIKEIIEKKILFHFYFKSIPFQAE